MFGKFLKNTDGILKKKGGFDGTSVKENGNKMLLKLA